MGDTALNDKPHCHGGHIAGGQMIAVPHAPTPIQFTGGCMTVNIGGQPALRVNDQTAPCVLAGCSVPSSPAKVAIGSASVRIGGMPAARVSDLVSYPGCVTVVPSPTGKVQGPGCPTVMIGG
jgi:uncharacterized Zn-binding protein involved in type VI secretion